MKQWDIVIINFPFTNLEDSKIRPALIISNNHFNKMKNVLLLAISTQQWDKSFSIPINQLDILDWNLNKESFIRIQNILSLEKRLVIKKVAKVSQKKMTLLKNKFISYIK